jgi:YD repeat-containing protein
MPSGLFYTHLQKPAVFCSLSFQTCHMKSACFAVLTLLLCVLFSCKKDSKDPAPPDNRPLQLLKKIVRNEYNGQVTTDSIGYSYDTAGHLTAITDLKTKQVTQKYRYEGDSLTAIYTFGANGYSDTVTKPVKYFDGGNTIFIDFTRRSTKGNGMDTVQLTYKWSGNQLLEAWSYLNLFNTSINFLQKSIVTYNSSGNQFESTTFTAVNGSQWQSRGVTYDQHKNFFSTLSRLNYIFMGWGFPAATRSVNNPVKGEFPFSASQEYSWTYNKDDYPLTMQVKGKNYLAVELTYNK